MRPGLSKAARTHDRRYTAPLVLEVVAGPYGQAATIGDERPQQGGADQAAGADPVRREDHSTCAGGALTCRAARRGRGAPAGRRRADRPDPATPGARRRRRTTTAQGAHL